MKKLCLLALLLFSSTTLAVEVEKFIYPNQPDNQRHAYMIQLLKMAVAKTESIYGPGEVLPSQKVMYEGRYLQEINHPHGGLNVIWTSTSYQKEKEMRPISIPLYRGLLGYRIALIDKSMQSRLSQVHSLCQLRDFSVGQGEHWGDVSIYEANHFKVVTNPVYPKLIEMLSDKRFSMLPLGATEIMGEYRFWKNKYPNLAIESSLLIHYPFAYYFFVNKEDKLRAERLQKGLEIMIKDGSLNRLFQQYYGHMLHILRITQRRIFNLENPQLPETTPQHRLALWFSPLISGTAATQVDCAE
ncbi:type 2 periplasmic-binding domain-containing protein [Dongshaea marina]|uniref:amino acid ABC transporter substrate-binding protein n=1 Tax=Dongshaea marina TaxID=2047966 RepID=UPI000D3E9B6E|nr:amino acid ABC transporter substrate-binding protein [Dongshaea marina]